VIASAPASGGTDLVEAVADAIADIGEAGGQATHLVLSPRAALTEASRPANDGHPLYPQGLTNLLGVEVAQVPGRGTDALVIDASRCFLVVARDFRVTASDQYAPAFKADKTALRVTGRFACAIPLPNAAIRKLAITP